MLTKSKRAPGKPWKNASPKSSLNLEFVFFYQKTDSWSVGTSLPGLLCISLANFYHLFNLFPIVDSTDSDSDDFPLLNPCLWSLAVFGWFQLVLFFQSTSSQIFQNTSDTSLAYSYLWFSNFQVVHNGQVRNIGPSKLVAATLTDLTHYFFIDEFFF